MIRTICALILFFSFTARAQSLSDTIPTANLAANFQVSPHGDGTMDVYVQLVHVWIDNGNVMAEEVAVGGTDQIVFSAGQTSVIYDPSNMPKNILLASTDGTYAVTFTRGGTGEVFNNSVTMPAQTIFYTPDYAAVVPKNQDLTMTWSPTQATGRQAYLNYNCAGTLTGDLTVNDEFTSATFPAGWAAACTGTVPVEIQMINFNFGSGYGSLVGATIDPWGFSFGDGQALSPLKVPTRLELLKRARQDGFKGGLHTF
jgi:hypothetical protein